jgi:hypothetical protein
MDDTIAEPGVSFPERPVGLAFMTLLVAMPYFINAGSSFVRVAARSPDYFIVFVMPPLFALIFAFLAGSWWRPLASPRPAAAVLNVVLRTGVIVVGSLIAGFVLAHALGAVWGLVTDPRTHAGVPAHRHRRRPRRSHRRPVQTSPRRNCFAGGSE